MAAAAILSGCNFISYKGNGETSCKTIKLSYDSDKDMETRTYEAVAFTGIRTQGAYDVKFTQADTVSVKVSAKADVIESLVVEVKDGILVLSTSGKPIRSDVRAVITCPALTSIEADGAVDLEISKLVTESLSIVVNGAGDVDVEGLEAGKLEVEVNGAGDVELAGKTGDCSLSIAGAGDIDARDLAVSGSFTKSVRGVGNIRMPKK